jgi:DNA helicase-2/ATP-dependent DNA helicase PcrA
MTVPSPEQQAIIGHPLEPLRVAAGAGTGKTSTMAWRLQALVRDHDIAPEQALGITFTNKAAEELAARLREVLPAEARDGREVEVTTYHGFAHSLVRELGPLIGLPRSTAVVTPGYVRQLLREALGAEPREHLNLTHPPTSVARLAAFANALGDNLLGPSDVIAAAGDEEPWPERVELAQVLELFEREKRRLGVADYADLVSLAHRILSDHPEAAARVRERYRVVLLDEYQDTNPAQRELLRLLFGGGFPITAVGDSDQTIYEWRGASLENFEGFPEHFRLDGGGPSSTLPLAINHRSGAQIVAVANAVRDLLVRKGPLPGLVPREDAPPGEVHTAWFHSAPDEARWIASQLVRRHDEGTPWGEMAVLFRKHRQIGVVRDALDIAGIPAEVVSLGGLLEVPVVADLHAWLRILGRPDDSPALMRVLLRGHYRLGLGDVAPLSAWARAKAYDDSDTGIGWGLLEAIDRLDEVEGLSPEARRRLTRFTASYRRLLEAAQASDLGELTRLVLDETGMWPEVDALPDSAALSARLNLYRFLDLTETWSPLEGRPSLLGFLDHLDLLSEENAADELDVARVSEEDAVALLTVHRAKGLEWDAVFLPGLVDGTFPGSIVEVADHTKRPHVLPPELRLDGGPGADDPEAAARAAHADQEIRTAYVAVTRARQTLVASGAWWYTDKKPKEVGVVFEAIDRLATDRERGPAEPGDPPQTLGIDTDAAPDPDPHFEGSWRGELRRAVADRDAPRRIASDHGLGAAYDQHMDQLALVLHGLPEPPPLEAEEEPFRTSVTGLVTFAQCPLRFHWSEVDRLPRRPTAALRRGVELHRRIELFNRGSLAFEDADEEFYDSVGSGEGTGGVAAAFDAFRESRFADERPALVEAPFDLKLGEARIAGRIDAAYRPDPGTLEVVDFKSGRKRDDPSRRVQLEAYGLAVNEPGVLDPAPERTVVTFAYFGDGAEELTEEVDDAWLADARTHLSDLVERASGGERTATPSEACRWCDFSHVCETGQAWLEANR